ncbi:MAG TPA: hypothetical protein VGK74_26090 [Symbiobacteriaceae bacterium]|jgi:hypothetical protein
MNIFTMKDSPTQFGLTRNLKLLYVALAAALSLTIILIGNRLTGIVGTVVFMLLGVLLGLVTFFISSGWSFQLEFVGNEIRVTDIRKKPMIVPLDKVGMLLPNGGFPFANYWLVVKNVEVGTEIPVKGVDPKTRELIDAYKHRNPGKKLTVVQLPGGYIRSVKGFADELKRRVPPVFIDERISK